MDQQYYNNLFNYLSDKYTSTKFSVQEKQQLKTQSKNFIIQNGQLYKKDKKNQKQLYRVVKKEELSYVLYMFHNDPTSGHFATDRMFEKIRK
jgi:hypothetical protein